MYKAIVRHKTGTNKQPQVSCSDGRFTFTIAPALKYPRSGIFPGCKTGAESVPEPHFGSRFAALERFWFSANASDPKSQDHLM
ncbi:hypothetical protein FKM82_027096 [Ascaphus truei]